MCLTDNILRIAILLEKLTFLHGASRAFQVTCTMLQRKLFLPFLAIAGAIVLLNFANEPPTGKTGAPGDGTCLDCHVTAEFNGSTGDIRLDYDNGTTYEPDSTYTLRLSLSQLGAQYFGFSMTALDSTGAGILNLDYRDSIRMHGVNMSSRRYLMHKDARASVNVRTDSAFWEFDWTAPASTAGPVTFYFIGHANDSAGISIDGHVHNDSLTLHPAGHLTGIEGEQKPLVHVFPNPALSGQEITLRNAGEFSHYAIYSLAGIEVQRGALNMAIETQQVQLRQHSSGIYLLHIIGANTRPLVRKLVIK
jgi:hypothetical protein